MARHSKTQKFNRCLPLNQETIQSKNELCEYLFSAGFGRSIMKGLGFTLELSEVIFKLTRDSSALGFTDT